MTITTLSSRELNQDVTKAKKAAKGGPVLITNRGKPAHVLLSIEEYQRLAGKKQGKPRSIADALAMKGLSDIDVDFPRLREPPRAAEFA
jgi:prevent-host-death family protein